MTSFEKIGVVGAGMMGSEIALMFALAGFPTQLSDVSRDAVGRAMTRLHDVLDRGLPRGFWTAEAVSTARHQLSVAESLDAYADRDFVIEAVFEDETLKRDLFRKLDAILPPEAGLASNTSSISITTLSAAVAAPRRARFIDTHFFSPASRMKLVELIPTADTDAAFVDAVMGAMVGIGEAPILVKDVVGFEINRLLHALVLESSRLVEESVCSPADIDVACKLGLGHPIGPFELMNNAQNSLSLSVHEIFYQAYGERFLPRPLLRQMVDAGYNGRKAGRGWYRYDGNGKKQ
jgi:3-hydroxybutyryl-CoA dehydrogenase